MLAEFGNRLSFFRLPLFSLYNAESEVLSSAVRNSGELTWKLNRSAAKMCSVVQGRKPNRQ